MSAHVADAAVARDLIADASKHGRLAAITVGGVTIEWHDNAAASMYAGIDRSVAPPSKLLNLPSDADARANIMREYGGDSIDELLEERDGDDDDEDTEAIVSQ